MFPLLHSVIKDIRVPLDEHRGQESTSPHAYLKFVLFVSEKLMSQL